MTKEELEKLIGDSFHKTMEPYKEYFEKVKSLEEDNINIKKANEELTKRLEGIKVNSPAILEDELKLIQENKYLKTLKFFTAVMLNDEDTMKQLSTGAGATGGHIVPDEFMADVLIELADITIIRTLARTYPVSYQGGNRGEITVKVTASWATENTATTEVKPVFGQYTYNLNREDINILYSLEMEKFEKSAQGLYSILVRLVSEAIDKLEEQAFINGDGSGKPTGILQTAGITSFTAGNLPPTYNLMVKCFYDLPGKYRKNSDWIINGEQIAELRMIKDKNDRPLWTEGFGDTPPRLCGRPVHEADEMPNTDIIFGDFDYYSIYDGSDLIVKGTKEGFTLTTKRQALIAGWRWIDGNVALEGAFRGITDLGVHEV